MIIVWNELVLMAVFVNRGSVLTFVSNGLAGNCVELDVHKYI